MTARHHQQHDRAGSAAAGSKSIASLALRSRSKSYDEVGRAATRLFIYHLFTFGTCSNSDCNPSSPLLNKFPCTTCRFVPDILLHSCSCCCRFRALLALHQRHRETVLRLLELIVIMFLVGRSHPWRTLPLQSGLQDSHQLVWFNCVAVSYINLRQLTMLTQ